MSLPLAVAVNSAALVCATAGLARCNEGAEKEDYNDFQGDEREFQGRFGFHGAWFYLKAVAKFKLGRAMPTSVNQTIALSRWPPRC